MLARPKMNKMDAAPVLTLKRVVRASDLQCETYTVALSAEPPAACLPLPLAGVLYASARATCDADHATASVTRDGHVTVTVQPASVAVKPPSRDQRTLDVTVVRPQAEHSRA